MQEAALAKMQALRSGRSMSGSPECGRRLSVPIPESLHRPYRAHFLPRSDSWGSCPRLFHIAPSGLMTLLRRTGLPDLPQLPLTERPLQYCGK